MKPVNDGRKLQETEVLETPRGTFVVTGVGYQDAPDGEHVNFTYQIKDPADLIADEPTEE
jgi:hypothetical protein